MEIPYGETRPYAWIAKRIKSSRAARAVGQAMGANPIPIIIP
jgi:O-6-methylguanine DNA methyltransferase